MQAALTSLRRIELQDIQYPSSVLALGIRANGRPNTKAPGAHELAEVDQFLEELENLLPSWSNNLSSQYFNHARTMPITMGQ
jgi:hypothetical protein